MGLLYHSGADPTRVYFGTDTHAMGLWLGAALAWILPILRHEHGRANESRIMERFHKIWIQFGPIVAFGSLLALLWMMRHITQGPAAFHGGIFVASVLAVMLIAGTIPFGSWMQDLLVFKPLAALGHYSYGIYLWHWPIMAAAEIPAAPVGRMACRQAAVLHLHPHRAVRVRILATVREASRSCGIHRVDSSDQWRRSRALRPSDIHGRGAGMLMELLRIRCGDGIGTNQCGAILGYQRQAVAATQSCRFGTTPNTDAKEATA